jgi:UDP-glucose 4-epimerase
MSHARVLVTGGAGFIGSELVNQLVTEDSAEVLVYDNLSFGHVANWGDYENLTFEKGDIRDFERLRHIIREFEPTHLYHLAAIHFIPYCIAHPRETIDINVSGTATLLEACKGSSVSAVVFASTAAVYAPAANAHCETDCAEPIDIYGLSKVCGEQLVKLFHRETSVRCAIARLFNAYGPRETNPHLIPEIVRQLSVSNTVQLGNLTPRRDYIHTSDLCRALRRMAALDTLGLELFNVASGRGYSAEELIGVCRHLLDSQITVVSTKERSRPSDRPNLVGDISKAQGLLRWNPKVRMEDGLMQLLGDRDDAVATQSNAGLPAQGGA